MCAKTDVSKMFHEGHKGDWFAYVLWQDWKYKPIYEKKYCNQEHSKETLSWSNFNTKGIITFPYDDKQIILLTSMRNNNPKL